MRAGLLALVLIVAAVTPVEGARMPKWARPYVESAPPAPEGVGRVAERILFDETHEEVRKDGTVVVTNRYITQALSSRSRGVGIGSFYFNDRRTIRASKAWHVPPGKGAKRNRRPPADITVGSEFLTDDKVRAVGVKGVKKGSLVLFEFQALERPYTLPRRHIFSNSFPAAVQRYSIELPEGWTLKWEWMRLTGPDPIIEGNTYTWELTDMDEPSDKSLGPSLMSQWPGLALNILPPSGVKLEARTLESWSAFSSWYEELLGERHGADDAVREAAGVAFDGERGGLVHSIGAAGRYVRDRVRYVAVELGIGAMQPRPATETLVNLYGDCKDKGTLFRSVLSTESVPSYPVLVNLSDDDTVSETIPAWGFDHYIVAVPLADGVEIPPSYSAAVLDAGGDLGRLLIVDTTDEKTSVGHISASLSGKRALLIDGAGGRLVTLPGREPGAHRITRNFDIEVTPAGGRNLTRESIYYGDFARRARWSYGDSAQNRRKAIERTIIRQWPEARIRDYRAEVERPDGAYVETVEALIPGASLDSNSGRIGLFPGARSELQRVSLGKRDVAVVYGHPRTIRYETLLRGAPAGSELPESMEESGEGWSVTSSVSRDGDEITSTWELVLERTRFEPEQFPELRALWKSISRTASAGLKTPSDG